MILPPQIKKQFPVFENSGREKNGVTIPFVYLDSAATAQKPQNVIDAMTRHMTHNYASVHRGVYELSARASVAYEGTRQHLARFISPSLSADEVIFTRGTTDGLNTLAASLGEALIDEDSRIVLTVTEHHANLIPWQQLALRKNCEIAYIPLVGKLGNDLRIDMNAAAKVITPNTKIVAFAHVGNVLGQVNPVAELAALAKKVGAAVIIDAAQSISCFDDDLFALGADAIVFGAHKLYGPSGVGAMAVRKKYLSKMEPVVFGGAMIADVSLDGATWADAPARFEAGTPPMTEVAGFDAAIQWLNEVGRDKIHAHASRLATKFSDGLRQIPHIEIYSPSTGIETVVSFRHTKVHAHDLATFLDSHNVAMRAGHQCAWPLVKSLGVDALVRASFAAYNVEQDVERALKAIQDAATYF